MSTKAQQWDLNFSRRHPLLDVFRSIPFAQVASLDWPSLVTLNQFSQNECISTLSGRPIGWTRQSESSDTFDLQYESRIFLKGEVPTRVDCWHDFFQVLVWTMFPKTKALLNARHYFASVKRWQSPVVSKRRSAIENAITLFDENGAIVVCSDKELLRLVSEFAWKKLFIEKRSDVIQNMRIYGFGHALFEKALSPYVGMTAHCVMVYVEPSFFKASLRQQIRYLDERCRELFQPRGEVKVPHDLQPVPVLGFPGWYENQDDSFYSNSNYFRSGRGSRQDHAD